MHIVFLDDTKHQGVSKSIGDVLGFGAIIVPIEKMRSLAASIDTTLETFGLKKDIEIKWSIPKNSPIRSIGDRRSSLYSQILNDVIAHDCKATVVGIDSTRVGGVEDAIVDNLIDWVFERVGVFLTKNESTAIYIADRPSGGDKEINQFIQNFDRRYNEGTEYVGGDTMALNVLTTPSRFSRGLQLADLITSITISMVVGNQQFAKDHWNQVKDLLIQNALGYIGGTGLKLYPDDLINLYLYLLNETAFTKARSGMGRRLPDPHSVFATNPYA